MKKTFILMIAVLLGLSGMALAGVTAPSNGVPYYQTTSGYHYYAFPTNTPPEQTVQMLNNVNSVSSGPVQDDGQTVKGLACWWQMVNAPASGNANTGTITINTSPDNSVAYATVETISMSANNGNAVTAVDYTGDAGRYWKASVTALQNAGTYINLWCTHNAYR